MAFDCDQNKAMFDQLQAAKMRALTGNQRTSVREGDDQVDYAMLPIARLEAEMKRLNDLSIQNCGVDLMGTVKQTRIASPRLAEGWREC